MKIARLLAGARITEHVMRALFLWSIPTANGIIVCGVILGTLFGWLGAYVIFGLYADKTTLPFDWGTNGILPFRQVAASITVVTIANRAFGKTARNVIEDDASQGVRPGYIFVGRFGTF